MPTVYIETSVIGYLTARPSRNLRLAADQDATRDWWQNERDRFELVVSMSVLTEIKAGDATAAAQRMALVVSVTLLPDSEDADKLSIALLDALALPRTAKIDAAHVAFAAFHGIDYLLTLNCRHINNAVTKPKMREVCRMAGYACPEICSPAELRNWRKP
jgi:predicted nucleic acid-binding protein